eukprot:2198823-Rhodomonas_salina.2
MWLYPPTGSIRHVRYSHSVWYYQDHRLPRLARALLPPLPLLPLPRAAARRIRLDAAHPSTVSQRAPHTTTNSKTVADTTFRDSAVQRMLVLVVRSAVSVPDLA